MDCFAHCIAIIHLVPRAVKVSDFIRIIGFYVDTALTRTDFAFQSYILGFCYAVSHAPIYVARARHVRAQGQSAS